MTSIRNLALVLAALAAVGCTPMQTVPDGRVRRAEQIVLTSETGFTFMPGSGTSVDAPPCRLLRMRAQVQRTTVDTIVFHAVIEATPAEGAGDYCRGGMRGWVPMDQPGLVISARRYDAARTKQGAFVTVAVVIILRAWFLMMLEPTTYCLTSANAVCP